MRRRKKTFEQTYDKGTILSDVQQLQDIIDVSSEIEVMKQTKYEDGTQSIQVTIYFKDSDE